MASVTYEARRGIVSYHVSGTDYDLDFDLSALVRPNGSDLKHVEESLDGSVETLFFGERRIWSATSAPLQASSALAQIMLEFLRSTADGQQFTFDPYGSSGSPVLPMSVVREDSGYTEAKFSEIDGVNDYVQFGFSVREV